MVESDLSGSVVAKVTIPPAFGLIPRVRHLPLVDLRASGPARKTRCSIEFHPATPLEYLQRWLLANVVFEDAAALTSVILWDDGQVSFGMQQPQYHGIPARIEEIERYFEASGWKRIPDPGRSGHLIYYNYAFDALAVDALPRNCYIKDRHLLPFDVILCRPDDELSQVLKLYPDS